ncbi:MAG TPA: SH3 domain-containing protein [Candidatus Paenalcaligenes intestinipullorum]|uniref:SH3 domain-containing protein n=1 Tax=Candidatus Paenalcaligenes intestinipullorum TaxID=2838718 RepID=A0A9D2U8X4_9BURK|nr:SH3 domain-containing protein [Candidatus Paenalcaligenes intestinipullorum]
MTRFSKTALATLLAASLGLSGCVTTDGGGGWGNKQTLGTAIGAVGGALLGGQIGGGSGKAVAAILGALAGGALGNWIGGNLDQKDQESLARSTQQALETGRTTTWASDHSGATATVRPVSTRTVEKQAQVKRAPTVAQPKNLAVINQSYEAKTSANLRAAPSTNAAKVGGLAAGQSFTAQGRTDNNWIAVSRKGVTIGYVHAPLVAPVSVARADSAVDLDNINVARAKAQGFDLDAIAPEKAVSETVAVHTTCRTMEYQLNTKNGSDTKTVDACQDNNGAWQIG